MMDYDVCVVGSGIGGLTAAALLAKAGKSVLVLEAHDRPGGYAHGFRRKKYHFDSGVHLISGCGAEGYHGGQIIYKTLKALDLLDQIDFININPFSHVYYPKHALKLPQTINAFVDTLAESFPSEREGLQAFTELCQQMAEEIALADELMTEVDIDQAKQLMPALFKYRKATLAKVASQFIKDPDLLGIFASNWPYLGLPPSKVSFVYWSTMLIGYIVDGSYYCKGGFQQLANTLVKGLQRYGGEIKYKSRVEKIIIDNNQVTGVVFNNERVSTNQVISNADLRTTVTQLIGENYFRLSYLQRIKNMQHSLSIFVVYIATNIDLAALNIAHESFYYNDYNHDNNFSRTLKGYISWLSITAPTLVEPDLAPEGEHLLLLTTLIPYHTVESWKQEKPEFTQKMISMAEETIPGLSKGILFLESGSPATMQRYTQNYKGAAYGWDVIPGQVGPARIHNQSPLHGLYFAGHWTSPGGGVYGVSVSGVQATQKILGFKKQLDFWESIKERA